MYFYFKRASRCDGGSLDNVRPNITDFWLNSRGPQRVYRDLGYYCAAAVADATAPQKYKIDKSPSNVNSYTRIHNSLQNSIEQNLFVFQNLCKFSIIIVLPSSISSLYENRFRSHHSFILCVRMFILEKCLND